MIKIKKYKEKQFKIKYISLFYFDSIKTKNQKENEVLIIYIFYFL